MNIRSAWRRSLFVSRNHVLRQINFRALVNVKSFISNSQKLPVFVIASPPDMHLAPMAVWKTPPEIQPVIMANGVAPQDVQWIKNQVSPEIPVVSLKASLTTNYRSFLSHAEVVRLASHCVTGDFVIQDADCFVLEPSWWQKLRIENSSLQYAAGPFAKPFNHIDAMMPDTFLVMLNGNAYRHREARGISPDIVSSPSPALAAMLKAKGLPKDYIPDDVKTYYDTLQQHWTAAVLDGQNLMVLPGADDVVMHVGGSSYLNGSPRHELSHWDYWPLNTPYFHLRVLEYDRYSSLRSRFTSLYKLYGSADAILEAYPEFKQSRRYCLSQRVLQYFRVYLEQT